MVTVNVVEDEKPSIVSVLINPMKNIANDFVYLLRGCSEEFPTPIRNLIFRQFSSNLSKTLTHAFSTVAVEPKDGTENLLGSLSERDC